MCYYVRFSQIRSQIMPEFPKLVIPKFNGDVTSFGSAIVSIRAPPCLQWTNSLLKSIITQNLQLSYRFFAIYIAQLYPYNQGKLCTVNTTTGLVYTESSTKGGSFVVLDGVNCTEYKLSSDNDGSSGELVLSVPLSIFQILQFTCYISPLGQYLKRSGGRTTVSVWDWVTGLLGAMTVSAGTACSTSERVLKCERFLLS